LLSTRKPILPEITPRWSHTTMLYCWFKFTVAPAARSRFTTSTWLDGWSHVSKVWRGTTHNRALAYKLPRDQSSSTGNV